MEIKNARLNNKNNLLIIFVRHPQSGTTKTRLIPAIGAKAAAQLQRKMTEYILGQLKGVVDENIADIQISFSPSSDEECLKKWLGKSYQYEPQTDGDLGHRMNSAFNSAFGRRYQQCVLIGSDCPVIKTYHIKKAFNELRKSDLVLGPASDGGYYLIALGKTSLFKKKSNLFTKMVWSTNKVFKETCQRAKKNDFLVSMLPMLSDVDEAKDLVVWEKEVKKSFFTK